MSGGDEPEERQCGHEGDKGEWTRDGGNRGPGPTRDLEQGHYNVVAYDPFSTVVARAMEVAREVAMNEEFEDEM